MNIPAPSEHTMEVQQALQFVQQAYRAGDRRLARRWAERAALLAPKREEPWLWLASLSSPQASLYYVDRALALNPQSEAARKARRWAVQRLGQVQAVQPAAQPAAHRPVEPQAAAHPVLRRPAAVETPAALRPTPRIARRDLVDRSITSQSWISSRPLITPVSLAGIAAALMLVMLLCLGLASAPFVQQAFAGNGSVSLAQVILDQPTSTPTVTATPPPTETPIPTPIPSETATPVASDTPVPSETFLPPPDDTSIPTDLPIEETPVEPPVVDDGQDVALPEGVGEDEHWIDVNLSLQQAYAYTGRELSNSFLVSTGTWEHPTVTGVYRIYVKYRYADMAGPGYYLPDVPYVMYFYEGYGLHGTYWHNNFGTPMSHGCVNFSIDDAGYVFDFVEVGTVVSVHY